jgi:hypothetical protein
MVVALMGRLMLTQKEFAEHCQVAQQTVSAWRKGERIPGRAAQRQVLLMAHSAGLAGPDIDADVLKAWSCRDEKGKGYPQGADDPILHELVQVLAGAPQETKAEVLAFARFRILHDKKAR